MTTIKRRSLLSGAAASLATPALGGTTKTLRFVPQSPLASLDPVWTSAMTTRNVAFQVYDVLFGRDAQMNPKPQMLAGYVVEDDGKRWVMTLRPDQWFHDGEPCWPGTALHRCGGGCSAIRRRNAGGSAGRAGGAGRSHDRAKTEEKVPPAAQVAVEIPDRRDHGPGNDWQPPTRSSKCRKRSVADRSDFGKTNTSSAVMRP